MNQVNIVNHKVILGLLAFALLVIWFCNSSTYSYAITPDNDGFWWVNQRTGELTRCEYGLRIGIQQGITGSQKIIDKESINCFDFWKISKN